MVYIAVFSDLLILLKTCGVKYSKYSKRSHMSDMNQFRSKVKQEGAEVEVGCAEAHGGGSDVGRPKESMMDQVTK